MKDEIYNFFELKKNATEKDIKKAYRRKAKKSHPDANGNREEFEKANKYYKTLINPITRKIYDETGKIDESARSEQSIPLEILANIFEAVLMSVDNVKTRDVFKLMKDTIETATKNFKNEIDKIRKSNSNIQEMICRIQHKEKDNIFTISLNQKVDINKNSISMLEKKIKHHEEALEILKEYKYRIDKDLNTQWTNFQFLGGTSSTTTTTGF